MNNEVIGERLTIVNKSVCVVLVTYNRKDLLINLLKAIYRQSVPVQAIVIVDNKSTDGTVECLINNRVITNAEDLQISRSNWNNIEIYYYRNNKNTGGSGGFEKAFNIANDLNYDYIWAMDDDVEPEHDCLEKLLDHIDDETKVLLSSL